MIREDVYSALFTLLNNSARFATASRKLKHWSDVPIADQPALFIAQSGETGQTVTGQPTKWVFAVDVYVYARAGGDALPSTIINDLLDSITAAIAPNPVTGNVQTLGGLAHRCYIDGQITTDEGTLGDQAVAIVPVRILAT